MDCQRVLQRYCDVMRDLSEKVSSLQGGVLFFKPTDDAWSISQHVVHVGETDINNYIRWRSVIGSPRSQVYTIDEDAWVKRLDYESEDINKYLAVAVMLRDMTASYLSKIAESEWTNEYFIRVYKGESQQFTIERCITMFTLHVEKHGEFIDRNISLYKG